MQGLQMLKWAGQLARKLGAVITQDRDAQQHLHLHHHLLLLLLFSSQRLHLLLLLPLLLLLLCQSQLQLLHQPQLLSLPHQVAPSIAMLVMMNGQCSGSRAGEVPRRFIAARLQAGAVLLSSHHHQGFLLQVFPLQKTWVLMIVLQDTIHATPAWRSTGLPTNSIGAARRKARDARATHHCTCRSVNQCACRSVDSEHAQGSPYLPACSDWWCMEGL